MKPFRDGWHMSGYLDSAAGAYIYTLLSGRCPMNDKPKNEKAMGHWIGQKVGYETAWRMNHFSNRVPGFQVRPKSKNAELTAGKSEKLDVRFYYPPKSDVVVTVSIDKAAGADVTPKTLTFTAENHQQVQTVTVTGKTVEKDTPLKISFVTKSKDRVFTKLKDAWAYTAKAPVEKKK